MYGDFWDKIANDGTNINTEILNKYFKHQNPTFLLKDLHKANKSKDEKIVNHVNDALIDLRNTVNRKELPENKNPDKVIDIVEEIFNLTK